MWDVESIEFAIHTNNRAKVQSLLQSGQKPKLAKALYGNLCILFNSTAPEILDLLVEYNALPQELSLSTLKLILYAMRNPYIKKAEFWGKPDLNIHGWPGLQSPISLFAQSGDSISVNTLIKMGVKERPLESLFTESDSPFLLFSCSDIATFKERISNRYSVLSLSNRCDIAVRFLKDPNDPIFQFLLLNKESNFLPLFVWAAYRNKADLFDLPYFSALFKSHSEAATRCLSVAAAFGSQAFLLQVIQKKLASLEGILEACEVASANGDSTLLASLMPYLNGRNTVDYNNGIHSAMFWGVYNDKSDAVEVLLRAGVSPDCPKIEYPKSNYLHYASRFNFLNVVKVLLAYKAKINHQDLFGETALHEAATAGNYDVVKELIRAGANTQLKNNIGETALDKIKDQVIRTEMIKLIREEQIKERKNQGASRLQFFHNTPSLSMLVDHTDLEMAMSVFGRGCRPAFNK